MANTDYPHGLTPVQSSGGTVRVHPYTKTASTQLHIGDPVTMVAAGTVQRAAAGETLVGSVVSIFDEDGTPVSHVDASDTDTYTVMVADDPDQVFEIQEDSDGGALAAADIGNNVDIVVTSGNDDTGLSKVEIDSSTKVATTAQLRLLGPVDRADNAIGDNCDWKVLINEHFYKATAGI